VGSSRTGAVVLDAGALIAFERGGERARALVRLAVAREHTLVVPAGALAQVWRDGRRQARLASLVNHRLTEVDPLDEQMAKAAGALCGRTNTSDVVDASIVLTARTRGAAIVTSDTVDLRRLDPGAALHEV